MLTAYRAFLPGVALLCSLAAFILALCCLLAGTNPNTLKGMELYTLNTSRVAATLVRDMHLPASNGPLNFSTLIPRADLDSAVSSAESSITNKSDSLVSEAGNIVSNPSAAIQELKNNITQSVDQAKSQVSDAVSKAEDSVKNATSEIVSTFINETIQTFHIHDFYIGHLLTYCEGNYTAKGKKDVTFCSNQKPNNKYNATTKGNASASTSDDNPLAFIETLHLPDPAEYGLKALTLLTKIISAFYIVGLISLVFSLVSSAFTIPLYFAPPTFVGGGGSKRTLLRWATLLTTSCSFFTLLLASAMVHFFIEKLCGLFNEHPGAGVAAYPGRIFQGCSWASVILMGIAMILAVTDLGVGLIGKSAKNRLGETVERRAMGKWWGKEGSKEEDVELDE